MAQPLFRFRHRAPCSASGGKHAHDPDHTLPSLRLRHSAALWASAAVVLLAGCASSAVGAGAASASAGNVSVVLPTGAPPPGSPAAMARADGGIPEYTKADVTFMQGMIGHHSQAVVMSDWAPTHGASSDVRGLAERIAVAQADEIAFMKRWLIARKQSVPTGAHDAHDAHDDHAGMTMGGMNMGGVAAGDSAGAMGAMMPGMLTAAQMSQLDKARGAEFDRLFLRYMIQHHRGALTMLDTLFGSRGAGQDDAVFKFASDVSADQSTEIARMTLMLSEREKNGARE